MILLTRDQYAKACGVDASTITRWTRDGICPPPILLDGFVRWPEPQVATWAALGCPPCEPVDGRTMTQIRRSILREIVEREEQEKRIRNYEPEVNQ